LAKQAEQELSTDDSKRLRAIVLEIQSENERKNREIFAEKKRLREAANNCENEAQKQRLIEGLTEFAEQIEQ
jgi:DNA-binding transcriptional regulator GbsR (MarR family)